MKLWERAGSCVRGAYWPFVVEWRGRVGKRECVRHLCVVHLVVDERIGAQSVLVLIALMHLRAKSCRSWLGLKRTLLFCAQRRTVGSMLLTFLKVLRCSSHPSFV